jgi:hypothetical protein
MYVLLSLRARKLYAARYIVVVVCPIVTSLRLSYD